MNRLGLALTASLLALTPAPAGAATLTLNDGGFGARVVKLAGTDPGGVPRWAIPYNTDAHVTGTLADDTGAPGQQGVAVNIFPIPFGEQAQGSDTADTAADGTFAANETIVRGTTIYAKVDSLPGFNIATGATSNAIDFYAVPHVQLIAGTSAVTRLFYGNIETLDGSQAKLYLERKSGRNWKAVKSGRADRQGNYTIHYNNAPRGTYRLYFHSTNQLISLDNVSNTVRI